MRRSCFRILRPVGRRLVPTPATGSPREHQSRSVWEVLTPRIALAQSGVCAKCRLGTGSAISTIWPALFPEVQNPHGRGDSVREATQRQSSLLEFHAEE